MDNRSQGFVKKFKKALVTGGAGFIGSHLVEGLLEEGLEVISVDNYVSGKHENLAEFASNPKLTEADCDVTDKDGLDPLFEGVDIVFHEAASKMTVCLKDPALDLAVNAGGPLTLLELALKHGVKKFVHASTGSVYGKAQYYPTDEQHPLNPASYYGVSKLAGEKYVRAFGDLYGMDTTVLRYYHVYGPRQESSDVGGVASIFARRALHDQPLIIYGDGSQVRSFTYVKDVVGINKLVAMSEEARGQAFNCASGIKVTIQQLADKILAYYGREDLPIQYEDWRLGDIKRFEVANQKIKDLGFAFSTDFDAGLAKTLDWAKAFFNK